MNKVTLELPVRLTDDEVRLLGETMAVKVIKYDEYEDEKKAMAKDLGDRMKALHGELSKLAGKVKRREEKKPVECEVKMDTPSGGTKSVVRLGTGETVKEMPMTADDLQGALFSAEELQKMFALDSGEEEEPEEDEDEE